MNKQNLIFRQLAGIKKPDNVVGPNYDLPDKTSRESGVGRYTLNTTTTPITIQAGVSILVAQENILRGFLLVQNTSASTVFFSFQSSAGATSHQITSGSNFSLGPDCSPTKSKYGIMPAGIIASDFYLFCAATVTIPISVGVWSLINGDL